MALRVISGVVAIDKSGASRDGGHVDIFFDGRSASGTGDVDVAEIQDTATGTPFRRTPCKTVALREIRFKETDEAFPTGRHEYDYLRLDDSVDADHLRIAWRVSGGSRIYEISFMLIGET